MELQAVKAVRRRSQPGSEPEQGTLNFGSVVPVLPLGIGPGLAVNLENDSESESGFHWASLRLHPVPPSQPDSE